MPDGILVFTTKSYEAEVVAALREWYGNMNRSVYAVGMVLPRGAHASSTEKAQSAKPAQIEAFLDDTLKTAGGKSLLYISFGSIYWPMAAPRSSGLPWTYEKGILSPWTPQQLILNHTATGWFLAHGGQNGVQEAIEAGVPQILWPFSMDQPPNAVHLSENLGVAYELMEVRVGHGLKPIYRTGRTPVGTIDAVRAEAREVLGKAFGADGARKRERLLELREAVRAEHEGGHAKRDVETLIDGL